jgi:tripartite-type tricarboxylate transporter receptor subunit TctC
MTSAIRISALVLAAAVSLSLLFSPASAEELPPLRVIVPCPPGSPVDAIARHLAKVLQDENKRPVIIENIRAASEQIGPLSSNLIDGNAILFDLGSCGGEVDAAHPGR